jgi:hypothetical protein
MGERIGRSHLRAFISAADGASWQGGLLLDKRAGVSYPDGQQGQDGVIRIIYDYDRTGEMAVLMAAFTEADARAGAWRSSGGKQRVAVSRPHHGAE